MVDRPPGQITLKDLLEIHKRVIGYVDPVEAGYFRQTQVFVGELSKNFHVSNSPDNRPKSHSIISSCSQKSIDVRIRFCANTLRSRYQYKGVGVSVSVWVSVLVRFSVSVKGGPR